MVHTGSQRTGLRQTAWVHRDHSSTAANPHFHPNLTAAYRNWVGSIQKPYLRWHTQTATDTTRLMETQSATSRRTIGVWKLQIVPSDSAAPTIPAPALPPPAPSNPSPPTHALRISSAFYYSSICPPDLPLPYLHAASCCKRKPILIDNPPSSLVSCQANRYHLLP
jgi:hypothetical protein